MKKEPLFLLSAAELEAEMLATGQKILELRKKGLSRYEVSMELDLPLARVKEIEEESRERVFGTISADIQEDRHLIVAQLNQVIRDLQHIADNAEEPADRIAALNGITRAIAQKSKSIGLDASSGPVTNNNTLVLTNEAKEALAKLGYGRANRITNGG